MGQILRNWRILGACTFSVLLMGGAYILAKGVLATPHASASEESELLRQIATRDTDGDGLPDWEEGLYGTDPQVTDSNSLGMTDREAVSRGLIVPKAIADISTPVSSSDPVSVDGTPAPAEGTLTAVFAQNLLSLYLAAKQENGGADISEAELQSIADQALASLSSLLVKAPNFKSAADLKVSGSGTSALLEFSARAEAVLVAHATTATTTEVNYLKNAIEQNDTAALAQLVSISKTYRESAIGLAALIVPQELAANHLILVNSMMRISEITSDFARVNTDPLATMLALQLYPQAVVDLGTAFVGIGETYRKAGIALSPGTPGAQFILINESIQSGPPPAPQP